MKEFTYAVDGQAGIPAATAGMVVNATRRYRSNVEILHQEKRADGKKIFQILGLGVQSGDRLTFRVHGGDEGEAAVSLRNALDDAR